MMIPEYHESVMNHIGQRHTNYSVMFHRFMFGFDESIMRMRNIRVVPCCRATNYVYVDCTPHYWMVAAEMLLLMGKMKNLEIRAILNYPIEEPGHMIGLLMMSIYNIDLSNINSTEKMHTRLLNMRIFIADLMALAIQPQTFVHSSYSVSIRNADAQFWDDNQIWKMYAEEYNGDKEEARAAMHSIWIQAFTTASLLGNELTVESEGETEYSDSESLSLSDAE